MNFFLSLLLCTNFFSWHFPLHEFYFGFFPIPPITFLMVRPLALNTMQCNAMQCNAMHAMQYNAIQYNTIQIQYNTIQYFISHFLKT